MEVSSFNNAICKCLVQRLCIDTILMLKLKNPTYSSCGTPDDKASLWCVIRSRHNRVSIYRNLRTAGYVILQSPPECPPVPPHIRAVCEALELHGHIMQHHQDREHGAGWGEDVVLPHHSSASCLERVCCCSCSLSMRITKLISRSRSDWSLYGKNPAERWGRKCWRRPDGGYQRMKTLPLLGSDQQLADLQGIYKVSSIGCWELSHY